MVPSLEEFRHRMKNIMLRYPYIVLEADGKVMGYAYAAHSSAAPPTIGHAK